MFATSIIGFTISTIWLTFLFIIWVLIALIPASIASRKGHSFLGWFLVSIFFWWITLFITLFMKDNNARAAAPEADS